MNTKIYITTSEEEKSLSEKIETFLRQQNYIFFSPRIHCTTFDSNIYKNEYEYYSKIYIEKICALNNSSILIVIGDFQFFWELGYFTAYQKPCRSIAIGIEIGKKNSKEMIFHSLTACFNTIEAFMKNFFEIYQVLDKNLSSIEYSQRIFKIKNKYLWNT